MIDATPVMLSQGDKHEVRLMQRVRDESGNVRLRRLEITSLVVDELDDQTRATLDRLIQMEKRMGQEYRQGYCYECQRRVRTSRRATNHVLHLLLSIMTLGLWLIVWSLASVKIGGWECAVCGSKEVKTKWWGVFGSLPISVAPSVERSSLHVVQSDRVGFIEKKHEAL